jgi:hypothetical protein
MSITLTMKENCQLWAEAKQNSHQTPVKEPFEIISEMPKQLGKGYLRDIEVHPELWLTIWDCEYHDDVLMKIPEWDHPLQLGAALLGRWRGSQTTNAVNSGVVEQRA